MQCGSASYVDPQKPVPSSAALRVELSRSVADHTALHLRDQALCTVLVMTRKRPKQFTVGDRVAYSVAWLKSCHMVTGIYPQLRGTVRAVEPFGDVQLVTIAWDNFRAPSQYHDDGLGRVIAPNLTLVSRIGIDSELNT